MHFLTKYKFWITGPLYVAGLGVLSAGCGQKTTAGAQSPPTEVEVVHVQQQDVPIYG